MKTVFSVDVTSLTVQESHSLLDKIDTVIGQLIEDAGFQYRLKASGDNPPIISYIVEDE